MKKIVITGGLGYIGMELCKIYSGYARKYKILVIDKSFYSSRVSQLNRWGIEYKQVDILDKENLKKYIFDADVIFHLAGITDVPSTKKEENNEKNKLIKITGVNGTRNIIKFSKKSTKIIFPSTHVIFEGLKTIRKEITEELKPQPVLEYAKGKYLSEQDLINSNKNYVILRLASVYGISFDSTRLNIMPNLFSKLTSTNSQIKLYGGGNQLKSLVSVIDVARAMEFSAENKEITKQIYNCTNENLTVLQVAQICKKYNKNIELVTTKDLVPNKGYTLSNKKIKKAGFRFLYNINESIKQMVEQWSPLELNHKNEILEKGSDEFIDNRGIISNYYIDDSVNMIGYVESKKGTIRGNHYHPIQTQKCLLIKGKYLSITKNLAKPNQPQETRIITEGELSTIPPYVAHTMVFLEDSIFLNLVNGERSHKNYGITHTIKYELVNQAQGEFLLKNYKIDCRACGSLDLEQYLSLGLSPLANNLKNNLNDEDHLYPLELNLCLNCFNTQLSVVIPPRLLFDNYLYLSSTTDKFKEHFSQLAKKLIKQFRLNKNSLVVDIGSNDGIFIEPLKRLGINALGVEPAKNVAKIANKNKLPTINSYFDSKVVSKIIQKYGKADMVTAFNVFAHADNLKQIARDVESLIKKNGVFVFEVQYFLDTINDLTFDNIYHEHVNFWTVTSLVSFFEELSLKIFKVEHVDTHGGSLRVYCSKNKKTIVQNSLKRYIKQEENFGITNTKTYFNFAERINNQKEKSLNKIQKIINENKKIVGFGAPAKATTVLNFFGIDSKYIEYIIEDNSLKHDKYIPGVNIKIVDKNTINSEAIDYILVLAWNFYDVIKKKNKSNFPKVNFIKLK